MKQSVTQSLSWLHTWAGLVLGWALVAIFVTGTLAVFDREITQWMQPELNSQAIDRSQAVEQALNYLRVEYPHEARWQVRLPTERSDMLSVAAGEQRGGGGGRGAPQTVLDPVSGEVIDVRETAGGNFFFRFHYTLNFPRNIGVWVVGFMAMAMLAAIVSGIVIHKKFFKEFFTFRPNKGQRSWLDYHNATGVLLLPFHIMITYTGLVIFFLIYMPAPVDALFDGDRERYVAEMRGEGGRQEGGDRAAQAGQDAPQRGGERQGEARGGRQDKAEVAPRALPDRSAEVDMMALIALAEQRMGEVSSFTLLRRGNGQMTFEASPVLGNIIELTKGRSMAIDALSGQILREPTSAAGASWVQRVMSGLHFAQFGGYPMRWLYFVCGLISSAMMAAGLILFTVKRRRRYYKESAAVRFGYELIERINIASVIGLLLACISLLWANRLLPMALEARATVEVNSFFVIWGLSFLHASLRPRLKAWREQLLLVGVLALCLPLSNLLIGKALFESSLDLYLELTSMLFGLLLIAAFFKVPSRFEMPVARAPKTGKQSKPTQSSKVEEEVVL